jgi:sterol desaturase/sphingolipid hydroxylase (fatty acid hydroxylase superfamily)
MLIRVNSTLLDAILFAVLVPLEVVSYVLFPDGGQRGYNLRDSFGSLSLAVGSILTGMGWQIVTFAVYISVYGLTPLRIHPVLWAWVALFVLDDFRFYWMHRAEHKVRILWAAHVNHHSSERLNLTTAVRQPWITEPTVVFSLPLLLLGFPPAMLFTLFIFTNLYQLPIHTRRVGKLWWPIELVLNTPSHHRVHHASNAEYVDKNFGGTLIIWDRIFRTFVPESAPAVYGIGRNIDTYNIFFLAFHEYISMARDLWRARGIANVMGILFRSPGWSDELRRTFETSQSVRVRPAVQVR